METNILVTTPEKWDVTTRKSTSTLESAHLVILDEIHLLNDERGWVIESIVARMFRTIERTQHRIRLVALSATLPNYNDVADFLKVNREKGLFHFDNNYRPVPLALNFVGVKNPKEINNIPKNTKIIDIYNEKCYEITIGYLKNDKQVLIFVHSRKQTVDFC
jgi:replicative superfamily II helicase